MLGVGGLPSTSPFYNWLAKTPYRWASPQGFVQNRDGATRKFFSKDYSTRVARITSLRKEVIPWCWPVPFKTDDFVENALALIRAGCLGVLVDAEGDFYSGVVDLPKSTVEFQLRGLLTKLAEARVPYGVLTYGAPTRYHPGFPWAAYAERVRWVLPMLYRENPDIGATIESQRKVVMPGAVFTPVLSVSRDSYKGDATSRKTKKGSYAAWNWQKLRAAGRTR